MKIMSPESPTMMKMLKSKFLKINAVLEDSRIYEIRVSGCLLESVALQPNHLQGKNTSEF